MVYQSEAFQNSPHNSVVFVECSAKFILLLSFLNVKTFINLQLNSFHLSTCYRKWAWNPKELTNIISLLVWKYHVEITIKHFDIGLFIKKSMVYCAIKLGQCVTKSIVWCCEIYVITLAMVNTYFFANKTWRRQWVSNHRSQYKRILLAFLKNSVFLFQKVDINGDDSIYQL